MTTPGRDATPSAIAKRDERIDSSRAVALGNLPVVCRVELDFGVGRRHRKDRIV